jgi:hypothetical protein
MIWFLRILFGVIFVSMVLVTGWASSQCALWAVPREVVQHPWFIATLFDAYWGFITFFVFVCYREQRLGRCLLWLVAILLLGNLAMSFYMLLALFRLPAQARLTELFQRET